MIWLISVILMAISCKFTQVMIIVNQTVYAFDLCVFHFLITI